MYGTSGGRGGSQCCRGASAPRGTVHETRAAQRRVSLGASQRVDSECLAAQGHDTARALADGVVQIAEAEGALLVAQAYTYASIHVV